MWPEHLLNAPPAVQLPSGYTLRTYRRGDEPRFCEVMGLAGWPVWNEEVLRPWLSRILPEGWFMAVHEESNEIMGSMAIVEHTQHEAQLRWLLLHPDIRGRGLGKQLMDEAIAFCQAQNYKSIFLWTEDLLKPAAQLYKSKGFVLTEEKTHKIWGQELTEQRYELKL